MTTAPSNDNPTDAQQKPCAVVPAHAVIMLTAGMAAAWFAAGSTGLVAHPLQRSLTWLALAIALIAAWPKNARSFGTWAILASGAIVGLLFTASAIPTLNVLAVAVVLAAIAQVSHNLTARVALIAALGATALGCFHFASTSIPTVWLVADGIGWMLGRLAGGLAGSRLEVGATFAGIDFLVFTFAIYIAWIICTAPPRRSRALWGAAAIVLGHFVYLVVLAYSEKLLGLLPAVVLPPKSDVNHVGIWTWTNGLRTLIPWNMPLVAMFIDIAIVAAMVRNSPWLPVIEIDPEKLKRQKAREEKEEVPGAVLVKDMLFRFGPPLLAIAAALLAAFAVNKSDLKGKKIVAYDHGYLNWLKPEYDSPIDGRYGMLPVFVESLGGEFKHSKDLSEAALAEADVLLLIHPDQPWPKETLDRVWDYVRRGGSLLLAAEPAIREGNSSSSFNDVLAPLAMEVRFDTAVSRAGNWEQSYDVLAHPATTGIDDLRNRFGIQLGSSIRTTWPARPVLVGRWGWSDPGSDAAASGISHYSAGDRLGDLVLAAEQTVGRGRVFVLGDTSPLQNDGLPNAFPFTGRLFSYLANRPSSPQAAWRQWLALATLLTMLGLMAGRPAAWQTMLTPTVLGVSLACCVAASYSSSLRVARRPFDRVGRQHRLYRRLALGCLPERFTGGTRREPRHRRVRANVDAARIPAAVGARRDAGAARSLRAVRLDRTGTRVFVGRMRRGEAVRPRRRDFSVHGWRPRVAADRSAVGGVRLHGSALAGSARGRRTRTGSSWLQDYASRSERSAVSIPCRVADRVRSRRRRQTEHLD